MKKKHKIKHKSNKYDGAVIVSPDNQGKKDQVGYEVNNREELSSFPSYPVERKS